MIIPETILKVADNSGGKIAKCIKILGGTSRGAGNIGSLITVSIRKAGASSIKKGSVQRAIIIRTKYGIRRAFGGSKISFSDNACVLLDAKGNPIGNRVFGATVYEIKTQHPKIANLASELV